MGIIILTMQILDFFSLFTVEQRMQWPQSDRQTIPLSWWSGTETGSPTLASSLSVWHKLFLCTHFSD
jgi:hypothetical protein